MRRHGLLVFAMLGPIGVLLCGGRNVLADRVTALETAVELHTALLADHEQRLAVLEARQPNLVLLDASGTVIGEVVPGTWLPGGTRIRRPSGEYSVNESGFSGGETLTFRDSSCAGPVFTTSLDWPTENGTSWLPFERPIVNTDLKARVRADASIADEEGLSTVQLFIRDPDCRAWFVANASAVFRLIEREDLSQFAPPFRVVEQ